MEYNDDEKYRSVVEILKQMPKVGAPDYFEADLMRKINAGRFEIENNFWKRLFLPSRLIPSAALAITVIVILFMVRVNSVENEDPLLTNSKLRENIIPIERLPQIVREELLTQDEMQSGSKQTLKTDGNLKITESPQKAVSSERMQDNSNLNTGNNSYYKSSNSVAYTINKSGLNYKIVNLDPSEKVKIEQLRAKIMQIMQEKSPN